MQRVAVLITTFVVALAAMLGAAVGLRWSSALAVGERTGVGWTLAETIRPTELPQVLWLGDSTLLGTTRVPAYPALLKPQLGGRVAVESIPLIGGSLWESYFLAGPAIQARPRIVVLTASLRGLPPAAHIPNYLDLAALIPTRELPRALLLPWHQLGMSLPRLLLVRALRFEGMRRLAAFADGLREETSRAHPVAFPPQPAFDLDRPAQRARHLGFYEAPVHPGDGTLRAMQETISLLASHGIATLVVVSPMPVDALRARGGYDEARTAANVDLVRRLASARGARVLDLHDRLGGDGFRDDLGHFSERGAEEMARAVRGPLVEMLEATGVRIPEPRGRRGRPRRAGRDDG